MSMNMSSSRSIPVTIRGVNPTLSLSVSCVSYSGCISPQCPWMSIASSILGVSVGFIGSIFIIGIESCEGIAS